MECGPADLSFLGGGTHLGSEAILLLASGHLIKFCPFIFLAVLRFRAHLTSLICITKKKVNITLCGQELGYADALVRHRNRAIDDGLGSECNVVHMRCK